MTYTQPPLHPVTYRIPDSKFDPNTFSGWHEGDLPEDVLRSRMCCVLGCRLSSDFEVQVFVGPGHSQRRTMCGPHGIKLAYLYARMAGMEAPAKYARDLCEKHGVIWEVIRFSVLWEAVTGPNAWTCLVCGGGMELQPGGKSRRVYYHECEGTE